MKKCLMMTTIKENRLKTITIIILVVSFLIADGVGFLPIGSEDFTILGHLAFPLCHANVFHLLCNIVCLLYIKPPYRLTEAIVISFIASFMPEFFIKEPIMGCSGVLFAMIGMKYGMYDRFKLMVRNTWLSFAITAFVPNVAVAFHVYCIALGFLWGYCYNIVKDGKV